MIYRLFTFVSFANLPLNAYMDYPPAASIEQFPYQQGQNAAELLLSLLDYSIKTADEQTFHTISLEPKLVVNKNTIHGQNVTSSLKVN